MKEKDLLKISETADGKFIVRNNFNNVVVKMGGKEFQYLSFLISDETTSYPGDLCEEEQKYIHKKFNEMNLLNRSISNKNEDISKIKLFQFNPDAFLERYMFFFKLFTNRIAVSIYFLIIVAGIITINQNPNEFLALSIFDLKIIDYVYIYILIFLTIVFHELAHGVVCKKYGGKVPKMGVMLFYFSPAFFCDVSDIYFFKNKRSKIYVLIAGVVAQWVISSLALIVYFLLLNNFDINYKFLLYYFLANIGISIINLFPFVKLDGYWILVQILDIPNLREKSFLNLTRLTINKNKQREPDINSKREITIVSIYGYCSLVATVAIWTLSLQGIYRIVDNYNSIVAIVIVSSLIAIIVNNIVKQYMKNYKILKLEDSKKNIQEAS